MKYWLMKSEPNDFSIDDLKKCPKKTDCWDGVRNYQARNFMKTMEKGDLVFFYHSNCKEPGIVGIMEVVKESYPDHFAFDKKSKYFDEKSTKENPRWFMVNVKFKEKFKNEVSLKDLKVNVKLESMLILRPGNRLSVTPVTLKEWKEVIKMSSND